MRLPDPTLVSVGWEGRRESRSILHQCLISSWTSTSSLFNESTLGLKMSERRDLQIQVQDHHISGGARMRFRTWTWIALAACGSAAIVITLNALSPTVTGSAKVTSPNIPYARKTSPAVSALTKSATSKHHKLTVMAVGGSSAQGYDAPRLDGYLTRALHAVSTTLHIPISFVNKAKSGAIPTMLAPHYDPLLYAVKPNIVIISWGLLNSISRNVPEDMFQRAIQSEVSMATKFGADVWIVTPPVTPATYVGHDVKLERVFAYREILGARAVHSPHVHVFDLLNAMKIYLREHHQSYKPYASNNWHMNQAGHVLAGHILADAILRRAKSIDLTS